MSARILLAEGEHSIEQTVAQSLTTEQIETVCADDGWSALCLLNETSPDVLIAEIALPNKSGYELCRYVREEPEFQSMPVVLIDDHFDPLNQDLASSVGANVYLSKPFEPSQLIEIVRKLLGSRQESYDEELASAMLPASSQQSPLLQSHGSAEVNAVCNADWILPARQPSGAQTGTDSLPETVPTHPRRGSYLVLWTVLAGAILAALALAILERNHISNAPTASRESTVTAPAQEDAVAVERQRFAAAARTEDPANKNTGEVIPSEGRDSSNAVGEAEVEEAAKTTSPSGSIGVTREPGAEVKRGPSRLDSSAVAPRQDSPAAGDDQRDTQVTRPRSVKSIRSNAISSHLRRSGQEMKKAGEHLGSGAKHFGESGGDAAGWAGKKVSRGAKAIGRALKKIF